MVEHILNQIKEKARGSNIRFIYTEPDDDRILLGADRVAKETFAIPYLIGEEKKINSTLARLKIKREFKIINPLTSPNLHSYAQEFYTMRKHKGMTNSRALELMKQSNYFGTMLLHKGEGDCLIGGASYTTAETLRPALEIIKTLPEIKVASSFFLMMLEGKAYFFADCAFNRYPDSQTLSEIALSTAKSAEKFGVKPKIAMLSFSTKGSGFGESVDTVRKATELVKKKSKYVVDGEIQLDAAIVPSVAKLKCPKSPLKGEANVLIFPSLDAGNIGYKLVERLAGAKALGPIVQGLRKNLNVLSRGCSVEDILNISAITVMRTLEHSPKIKHFPSARHLTK